MCTNLVFQISADGFGIPWNVARPLESVKIHLPVALAFSRSEILATFRVHGSR